MGGGGGGGGGGGDTHTHTHTHTMNLIMLGEDMDAVGIEGPADPDVHTFNIQTSLTAFQTRR